jgi:hypothetical protein
MASALCFGGAFKRALERRLGDMFSSPCICSVHIYRRNTYVNISERQVG